MNKNLDDIKKENIDAIIPTGWNIYEWADKNPDTTIAHSLKRVEKIFDFSDSIFSGFSSGKDSTVSANLALLELNMRKLRVKHGIDRDGNPGVDPLDKKWEDKRISMAMVDAEVVFTFSNDYAKRFLNKYGPQGLDLLEFTWICYPLAWQSGVSFDSGILISWDKEKEDIWVQPMPTKDELSGFETLNQDNLSKANPVALKSLSEKSQKFHKENKNFVMVKEKDLFGSKSDSEKKVRAVANYGRGPIRNFRVNMEEKDEQDAYSAFLSETTHLVSEGRTDEIKEALMNRYDISKDVWFIKPDENGFATTSLISLRAEESLDRRIILSQGEYSTGQYSRNNGCNICSPVFDYSTSDIWRLLSATNWDVNEVYEKLYEVGVAPADQRVGSLLNYAAVRSISTVKALEPDLYGRINGRFQNVEFMSQFSRAGYYKIGKPKDVRWDGMNHQKAGYEKEEISALTDEYCRLLDVLDIPYERNDNIVKPGRDEEKGKPWYPLSKVDTANLNPEDKASYDELAVIHTTWRDYTLLLLNSTPDPLRSIWREKIVTSLTHWEFNSGSISEGNLAGLEILSELPDEFTNMVVDSVYPKEVWKKISRLPGSRRMKVFIGTYPQESLSNEANLCIKHIVENWGEYGHLIEETPVLNKIWNFAQESSGNCILPDEALTYTLEKEMKQSENGAWVDAARDIYKNGIPSDKFAEYYRAEKIEDFPLASKENGRWFKKYRNSEGALEITEETLDNQKQNFLDVCDIFLKEDVSYSPCWKKIAICILKNDVSMGYAGFSRTHREMQAREKAMEAFDTKRIEQRKAKEKAEKKAKELEEKAKA